MYILLQRTHAGLTKMIHGYMMTKYRDSRILHSERVSIRQNANPKACTREVVTINQMLQEHRLPSPITPSIHSERDVIHNSLNRFSVQDDCSFLYKLRIEPNRKYRNTEIY